MSDKYHKVIGIDLGTTYSAVAVFNRYEEETEIIENSQSVDAQQRPRLETTPSVISRDPQTGRAFVGWPAKLNLGDPVNTIIEVKREMGEVFTEETLRKFHGQGLYRAKGEGVSGHEGDPVRMQFCSEWFLPQEISAFTLMKMKEVAEAHIGEPIIDAVITVPAYFTERQKKATKEAALLAGLYPRQLIPEPTAAAICYGVDRMESKEKVYLVYDLGGGTFDVSIIRVDGNDISVLATSGDPRLGGGDFDDAIVNWATEQLKTKYQLDPTGDREKMARLKAHAEQMKKDVSSLKTTTASLIDIWPQAPSLELTREVFEGLIEPMLNKSLTFVEKALNQAQSAHSLKREKLNGILLVGGSTKIPRAKEMLLKYFQEEESFVSAGLNPDEVVARGAATVALKFAPSAGSFDITRPPEKGLIRDDADDLPRVELITEHSLGLGVQNNLISRIIDQGTYIPASQKQGGFVNGGPTEKMMVPVYQGEGQYTYENTLIGMLEIGPMEPKPEGQHKFDVTFSLDEDGILSLTVNHLNEGKVYQKVLDQKTGVGSVDVMATRRAKLLEMYSSGPSLTTSKDLQPGHQQTDKPASSPGGTTPKAPVMPHGTTMPFQQSAPVQPQAQTPVQTYTHRDVQPQQAQIDAAVNGPTGSPILEVKGTVPEEFRSIVRRANKLLLDQGSNPVEKLLTQFNKFVTLLNGGASVDQLEEAGDGLADAYHDCR